jgi:hypothetical protein
MHARPIRRRTRKSEDRSSGTFEIPASSRVARRGSTRVEERAEHVDEAPRSRGSSARDA